MNKSKISKPCPIPGCGGVGENLTSDTSKDTKCTKCGFLCRHDFWQSLPRPSEDVLEVARQIKVWRDCVVDAMETVAVEKECLIRWIAMLEQAAPGMGSVWVKHPKGRAWTIHVLAAEPSSQAKHQAIDRKEKWTQVPVHGTPQPKTEAKAPNKGECEGCETLEATLDDVIARRDKGARDLVDWGNTAIQRAETAEREKTAAIKTIGRKMGAARIKYEAKSNEIYHRWRDTVAERDTALADAKQARVERDEWEKDFATLSKASGGILGCEQRKKKLITLREQLAEAEKAVKVLVEANTKHFDTATALAERVRELEGGLKTMIPRACEKCDDMLDAYLHDLLAGKATEPRWIKGWPTIEGHINPESVARIGEIDHSLGQCPIPECDGEAQFWDIGYDGTECVSCTNKDCPQCYLMTANAWRLLRQQADMVFQVPVTVTNTTKLDAPTPPTTAEVRIAELEEAQLCHNCSAGPESGRDFYCTDCANVDYSYDVPTPPTTASLPVCPRCGKAPEKSNRQDGDVYHGCTPMTAKHYSRDEWLRYCAENTKCRECGERPEWSRDGQVIMRCSGRNTDTCYAWAYLTPAEWLDNNPTKCGVCGESGKLESLGENMVCSDAVACQNRMKRRVTQGDNNPREVSQTEGYLAVIKKQGEEARAQRNDIPTQRAEALRYALRKARSHLEHAGRRLAAGELVNVADYVIGAIDHLLDWAEAYERGEANRG